MGTVAVDIEPGVDQTNSNDGDLCAICFTDTREITLSNDCAHVICRSCLRQIIEIHLSEGNAVIPCPFPDCGAAIHADVIEEATRGNPLNHLYVTTSVKAAVVAGGTDDIRWCPSCGQPAVGPNFEGCPKIACGYCKEAFCYFCSGKWHPRQSCRRDLQEESKNMRRCPRCAALIFKTGGCNSMACSGCHGHFCWICGKEIAGPLHFSGSHGCPYFDELPHSRTQKILGVVAICFAGLILIAPICLGLALFVMLYIAGLLIYQMATGPSLCCCKIGNIVLSSVMVLVAAPFIVMIAAFIGCVTFVITLVTCVGVFYFYLPLTTFFNFQHVDEFITQRRLRNLADPIFSV